MRSGGKGNPSVAQYERLSDLHERQSEALREAESQLTTLQERVGELEAAISRSLEQLRRDTGSALAVQVARAEITLDAALTPEQPEGRIAEQRWAWDEWRNDEEAQAEGSEE